MGIEIEQIRAQMEEKRSEKAGSIEFVSGLLNKKEVVTAVCGIGKVAAGMCAQAMILKYSPSCIINSGVAGSLSNSLNILDVVVGESLVQHDFDISALGDPLGFIPGLEMINIPCDNSLANIIISSAKGLGINAVAGIIASGDRFISSDEKKSFIVKNFGAVACEMEGAAIAQACYSNNVPFTVVRAISDCADGASQMDYPAFLPRAAKNASCLIVSAIEKLG